MLKYPENGLHNYDLHCFALGHSAQPSFPDFQINWSILVSAVETTGLVIYYTIEGASQAS